MFVLFSQFHLLSNTDIVQLVLSGLGNAVYQHETWEEQSNLAPMPGLFDPDGDIILVFLSPNGIDFYGITSDPWYRATIPGDAVIVPDLNGTVPVYQQEEAASPLGCLQQFQFCNPSLSSNKCGPLASWADAQVESAPLFGITTEQFVQETAPTLNSSISSRYEWLILLLSSTHATIGNIIVDLGPEALTSIKYLSHGYMGILPANQWQVDVRYWWATYLASLQAGVVNTAHGPADPALAPYRVLPIDSHAQDMCDNQVRYLSNHVSGHKLM